MPLTNEELFDLAITNEDLKPVLWERVKKLAYMLASNFHRRNGDLCRNRGLELSDLKQLSYLAFSSLFGTYDTQSKEYGYNTALRYALSRQLREALGRDTDTLNRITSSLDELVGDEEDGRTVADLIADEESTTPFEDIADSSEREVITEHIREAVAELPEQEQAVIQGYYYDNKTLADVGEDMHVSGERVRQIHRQAIKHLRKPRIYRRLMNDLGYSSYRLYDRHSSVEYIATERAYIESICRQYTEEQEERKGGYVLQQLEEVSGFSRRSLGVKS